MKVIRYSLHGFEPQKQTHHMKGVYYELCEFDIKEYPEHIRDNVLKIHKQHVAFYAEHLQDLESGIWCFIDGYKSNLALNHLKQKVPCWEAELPDDTECYDPNWERFITLSSPDVLWGGCFIPERELCKLSNVKRR